tara:strand:- start:3678 stop:3944 length:267 start_codon:yes stop_codon:yes gene_type:complete
MKIKTLTFIVALSTLAFTLSAQAHDPKEHMKDAEKPDCAAMKNMDHSKMDMQDPIAQAMMKQCMGSMDKPASEMEGHTKADESTGHQH